MNNRFALLVGCLALGLVATGCGGDDDKSGSAQTAEQPADPGATEGGVTVAMKDIKFVPMEVTVKSGGTIRWTNDDSITHTVTKTSGPGEKFDSGNVQGGGTFERKFEEAGKVDYVCTIHPQQTGTITVE